MSSLMALLVLLGGSPLAPVVCFAAGHTEVEMPFAGCCARHDAPAWPAGVSLEPSEPNCGGCTDVPLISATAPQPPAQATPEQPACTVAGARPAALADAGSPRHAGGSLLPPAFPATPVPLRC